MVELAKRSSPEAWHRQGGSLFDRALGLRVSGLRRSLQTLNCSLCLASNAGVHVADLTKKSSPKAWDRQRASLFNQALGLRLPGLRRILQTLNGTRCLASNTGVHVAELAKKSSPEAWDRQGVSLFNRGIYDAAQLCFRKSGNSRNEQRARAAELQQSARQEEGKHNLPEAHAMFAQAERKTTKH